ncbi:MAG: hypothetical protein IKN55_05165 [Oscillospiraceae bacterium]|nr:hypothetical protein [Oscillospiraceae bacterium]
MAIYLVDYENVYIEGLQGIEELTEQDTLHIFYTQNRCGLTFGLYEQLLACKAKVELNEVDVSPKNSDPVKNALDIQLMMFLGYLIGSKRAEQLFIVSRDKDFTLGTAFYERFIRDESIDLRIVPDIAASFGQEEPEPEKDAVPQELCESLVETMQTSAAPSFAQIVERYASAPPQPAFDIPAPGEAPMFTVQYYNTVRNLLGKNTDAETVSRVCEMISVSDTLVDFNNALARFYRDGQRAKVVYHKFKPRFEDLRHLSRAGRKG